jgi:hypothetical protein
MKKLILISALLLSGCDQINDTRLICDCDFRIDSREDGYIVGDISKTMCYSERYDVNSTLVINELKKKFVWDGVELNKSGTSSGTSWSDDSISWESKTDSSYKWLRFNRINLVFTKTDSWKSNSDSDTWINTTTTYACRVVDGV